MIARARRLVATSDRSIASWILSEPDQLHGAAVLTVVLLRDDRTVGFEREDGELVAALVQGNVVVIERKNRPRWTSADRLSIVSSALHIGWSDFVSCTEPSKALIDQLGVVSRNELAERKNRILAKHGKAQHALMRSRFDDWLLADDRIEAVLAKWLIDECQLVAVWKHSEWGQYVCFVTRDVRGIEKQLAVTAGQLGIEFEWVESRARLPCW